MKRFLVFFITILCLCTLTTGCTQKNYAPEITYSTWGAQSEMQILQPIIADFERQNNVHVKLIHTPQNYFQKLHLLFASKQAPDVIFINNYYLPVYAKAGLLEDLNPYFKDDFENNIFFQNAVEALSVNGIRYGIPRDISNVVIYYNKDIFDTKKINYPDKNWNYFDLLTIAKKLTGNGIWGIGLDENPIFWTPILWSNGGGIFSQNGEFILNSPQSKDALKYYIELRTQHNAAPTLRQSANRTQAQMFLDRKIAMMISGRWLVPKYREEAHFDWDIVNPPAGHNGVISGSDCSGWAIPKSAKNKELAAKFIKHMSSKSSINAITQSGLITPARKDSAFSSAFLDGQKPQNAKVFLDLNKNAIKTPVCEDYNRKIEQLSKILEPYFLGEKKITPTTKFEL